MTPLSKAGKMFCMMYAMLGIPLTLVLLSALVERLMIPATYFLQFLNSRLGHLYQVGVGVSSTLSKFYIYHNYNKVQFI